MYIKYFEPLSDAWGRMVKSLFKPFDIRKWFVVGFTAFLAGLTDCAGSSGNIADKRHDFHITDLYDLPSEISYWLAHNPIWATLIFIGIFIIIVLVVVFTWLSSRGKFMFLDNVVHDKVEVAKPWYEYNSEGNSLFVWRLIFGFIGVALIVVFLIAGLSLALAFYEGEYETGSRILITLFGGLFFLVLMLTMLYIDCFLDNFVIPIMYKERVGAIEGWSRFLKLFGRNTGSFILFGLVKAILNVFMIIGVILIGLFTCCLGFLLLIIPYIGDVVFLPLSYAFRAFGVEFLEQFGDEFKFFPIEEVIEGDTIQ